jgi:hypothetical protein
VNIVRPSFRRIAAWAPLPAALSMLVYGIALDAWPLQAGHFFASVFRLDPFTLLPIHGWLATLPGIAGWIVACYAATVSWAIWRAARARGRLRQGWAVQDATELLSMGQMQDR